MMLFLALVLLAASAPTLTQSSNILIYGMRLETPVGSGEMVIYEKISIQFLHEVVLA